MNPKSVPAADVLKVILSLNCINLNILEFGKNIDNCIKMNSTTNSCRPIK